MTCTYCKKVYIGKTWRRLGGQFLEHLGDVERSKKDASKPAATYFNLPNHSKKHVAVCILSLHQGGSQNRQTLGQKFLTQKGTLNPYEYQWTFFIHSINIFLFCYYTMFLPAG